MDKYGKCISILLITLGFYLTTVGFAPRIQAQSKNVLEVNPAYLDVTLGKNVARKTIEITYINKSDHPVALELFPIDFNQSDDSGAYGFLGQNAGSYSYSLSSFLSFESNRIDLDPGQKHVFTVVIQNRPDLSPGGHYAAVVAREIQDKHPSSAAAVAPAVSTMIFLSKEGGERYNLSLKDMDWPQLPIALFYPSQIQLTFQNDGNVHVTPYGTITVKDILGRVVDRGIINESSLRVLPESQRIIAVAMHSLVIPLPISFNTITVRGHDSMNKTTFFSTDTYFYVNPFFFGGLVLLFVGVTFLIRYRGRQKKV